MKRLILSIATVALSMPAMAIEMDFAIEDADLLSIEQEVQTSAMDTAHQDHGKKQHPHKKMCPDLNFSPAQKSAYRQARQTMQAEAEPLVQQMKKAGKNYSAFLHNVNVPEDHAEFAANRMNQLLSKLISVRTEFFHAIVYDIASIDQREALLKCVRRVRKHMMMKKMHEMCKHHHGKHGKKKEGHDLPKDHPKPS